MNPMNRKLALLGLLVLLTVGAHAWELNGEFVFDDIPYILLNPEVQRGLGGDWWRFFTDRTAYSTLASTVHYRPLVALSYAFDASLGWGTFSYKLTQLVIHLLTVLALFGSLSVLRRHLPALPRGVPFLAAAWVGVVPFNVEAVHYMAARSSLLCGMFAACAFGLYLTMRLQERPLRALLLYAAHLAALGAALLCKETALPLPAVMLAADLLLIRRGSRPLALASWRLWWPYLPYAAGLALVLVVMPNVNHAFNYLHQVLASAWRLPTAFYCLVENIRLMVFPTGLTVVHPIDRTIRVTDFAALANMALVLALLVWVWLARRRMPLVAFGWLWYLLLIAPSTFVHLNVVLLEHRGYAASFGVGMALAALAGRLWGAVPRWRRVVVAGLVCVAILLVAVTVQRERVWGSGLALWEDAVAGNPAHPGARANRGLMRAAAGRLAEAEADFRWVLDRDPTFLTARNGLIQTLSRQGRYDEALALLEPALEASPDDPRLLLELARIHVARNRPEEALRALRRLAKAETANARRRRYEYRYAPASTATEMVRVALAAGRLEDAVWAVRHLRAVDPNNPQADYLAFQVDMAGGDRAGAAAALDRLAERLPGDPRVADWRRQLEAATGAAPGVGE